MSESWQDRGWRRRGDLKPGESLIRAELRIEALEDELRRVSEPTPLETLEVGSFSVADDDDSLVTVTTTEAGADEQTLLFSEGETQQLHDWLGKWLERRKELRGKVATESGPVTELKVMRTVVIDSEGEPSMADVADWLEGQVPKGNVVYAATCPYADEIHNEIAWRFAWTEAELRGDLAEALGDI